MRQPVLGKEEWLENEKKEVEIKVKEKTKEKWEKYVNHAKYL